LRAGVGGVLGDMPHLGDFAAADDADLDHNSTPPGKLR
jgi:hypothetical protein